MTDNIEIKIDNKEIEKHLLKLADKTKSLRPLMKNIAGIFAYSTEENFKEQGKPKWKDLAESTKKRREKKGKWPGSILQVEGQSASSITTYYDDTSAVIGSNKDYAAIHQLGGYAGKNKKVKIDARPYLQLDKLDTEEIIDAIMDYLKEP